MNSITYNTYDHRVKELIIQSKNTELFPNIKIPKSTIRSWMNQGIRKVISPFEDDEITTKLQKYKDLENKYIVVETKLKLLNELISVFGWQADWTRLPGSEDKQTLLKTIKESTQKIKLTECLNMLGLSKTRYYDWINRAKGCALEDYSSCPKTKPTQMTVKEVSKIKEMVTSKKYSHFTIRALSFYAKKIGAVFASAATWCKLVKLNKWRRPRKRLYPKKPRVGVRADEPNGIWHIDVTVLKLLDGTKAYTQAVIDNYSRYVLAWKVSSVISSFNTKDLLNAALKQATTLSM